MTLKPVFRPVFVIALLGWLVAFGFIAELVLPNLVTRGIGFAYRQVGLASPFAQGRMLIEEPVETLEFEFTFHPFEDLPTRRPAALLGDGPETFFVAERRAPLIRETEFQSFLDEEGFDIATDERTGLLDVIVVDGAYFASLVLTEGDCVFVALYDVQARELVDRFPCFDASEHEINPNVTGGAWLADGGWVYRATGIGQTQTWTRQNLAAQDPDSPYGKVLRYRIDRAGAGVKLVEREVFTSGHRNPQGMAKIGDQIVLIEHGARGGDEINVLKEGGNYGWPLATFGGAYTFYSIPPDPGTIENLVLPAHSFAPAIAPANVAPCPSRIAVEYEGFDCMILSALRAEAFFIVIADFARNKVFSVEKVPTGLRTRRVRLVDDTLYFAPEKAHVFRADIADMQASE